MSELGDVQAQWLLPGTGLASAVKGGPIVGYCLRLGKQPNASRPRAAQVTEGGSDATCDGTAWHATTFRLSA